WEAPMYPLSFAQDLPPIALLPLTAALVAMIALLGLLKSRRFHFEGWVQSHLALVFAAGASAAGISGYAVWADDLRMLPAAAVGIVILSAAIALVAEQGDQWRQVP